MFSGPPNAGQNLCNVVFFSAVFLRVKDGLLGPIFIFLAASEQFVGVVMWAQDGPGIVPKWS